MNNIETSLKDWIPFRLKKQETGNNCQWLYLGNKLFTEPFFDETVSRCRSLPENSQPYKIVSGPEMIPEWAGQLTALSPAAIIFHVSRCGSTLLSQLLAQNKNNIALSEVPFFDELLLWGYRNNKMNEALPLLKDAISFYGKIRNNEKQLYIKADSWHIHFYAAYRQLYPDIPFILLYRRPDEVIRSHQKLRGMHAVQGVIDPSLFGFDDAVFQLLPDEYTARVLETYYTTFTRILKNDTQAFAFDYKEGVLGILRQIMDICGIRLTEGQLALMKERSLKHSKHPEQGFHEPPLPVTIPAFQTKAFELYNELDKLRNDKLMHR
jgi:hypothetical protein